MNLRALYAALSRLSGPRRKADQVPCRISGASDPFRAAHPPRIFGIRLRRLSISHALLLEAIGSPFAAELPGGRTAKREAGLGDLIVALLICGKQPRAAEKIVSRPKRLVRCVRWHGWCVRLCRSQLRLGFDCLVATAEFRSYLRAAQPLPDPITLDGKAHDATPTELETIAAFLVDHRCVTKREALDTPLGLALGDYRSAAKSGSVRRVSALTASEKN